MATAGYPITTSGGISVDIRDHGFAQTGGDLFVSVASANVLWTGNPIVAQAPAVPWLLSGHLVDTRDTLQAVFDGFDAEVTAAIADGLSLEETVARVQLPAFQGYALFGWVHPNMNVPSAYNDLK